LVGLPLAFMKKRLTCQRCDHSWRIDAQEGTPSRPNAPYRTAHGPRKRDGNPVFRLRRGRSGAGFLVGASVGAGAALVIAREIAPVAALIAPLAGWFVGRGMTSDFCSDPDCRALLAPDVVECPSCRGTVEWVIHRAADHYAAKAEWHRSPTSR